MRQIQFPLGLRPGCRWGSLTRSPDLRSPAFPLDYTTADGHAQIIEGQRHLHTRHIYEETWYVGLCDEDLEVIIQPCNALTKKAGGEAKFVGIKATLLDVTVSPDAVR